MGRSPKGSARSGRGRSGIPAPGGVPAAGPPAVPRPEDGSGRGFSLVELLAALLLTVITVLGLAHTLGMGTGFIDRFATARAGLARATGQLESVRARVRDGAALVEADSTFAVRITPEVPGSLNTRAVRVDDPVDGIAAGSDDYYRVAVTASWRLGGISDSIRLVTLMREP